MKSSMVCMWICVATTLATLSALAQATHPAYLVRNINQQIEAVGSDPDELRTAGDRAYFLAHTRDFGTEIWSTDGTRAGTRLAIDLCPGSCSQFIRTLYGTRSDRLFYFTATSFPSVDELRQVDLVTGTDRILRSWSLLDLPGTSNGIGVRLLGAIEPEGTLIFSASGTSQGEEPWASDGTPGGTRPLGDLNAGADSSIFNYPSTSLDDAVLFWAYDPATGIEVWRTDGTAGGTRLLKDIGDGPASGRPGSRENRVDRFLEYGADRVFLASDGTGGDQLWITDGTTPGTRKLSEIPAGRTLVGITADEAGGPILLLLSDSSAQEVWGVEPDGGTRRLGSFDLVQLASFAGFRDPFVETVAYFTADDDVNGLELWSSDGTPEGTRLFHDFCSGPCGSSPQVVGSVSDRILVLAKADGPEGSRRLWALSRAPGEEPTPLGSIETSGSSNLNPDLVIFLGTEENRTDLWRSDGTPDGTFPLTSSLPNPPMGNRPRLTLLDDRVVFTGNGVQTGLEPWVTDGTVEGTQLLANVGGSDEGDSHPRSLVRAGEEVFFVASERFQEPSVWRTDGTTAGTRDLEPILVPPEDGDEYDDFILGASGDSLFVFGQSAATGDFSLQTVEPVSGLATLLGETNRPVDGPASFGSWQGDLLFFASGELFRASAATESIESLGPLGSGGAEPGEREFASMGDHLYFSASAGAFTRLWRTDGTAVGTETVSPSPFDIGNEAARSVGWVTAANDRVFFVGTSRRFGRELFGSDGTPEGTAMLFDLRPGNLDSNPRHLAWDGTGLWFTAEGPEGLAIWTWRPDQPAPGSVRRVESPEADPIVEIVTTGGRVFVALRGGAVLSSSGPSDPLLPVTPAYADPSSFTLVGSRVVFAAYSQKSGREPWVSDGTVEGTGPVADIASEHRSSNPGHFTRLGSLLLLPATDGIRGEELWALPIAALDDPESPEPDSPPPPTGTWLTTPQIPGFRFQVAIIAQDGTTFEGKAEPSCLPETLCVSGALPGRSEVFLRVIGPRPNGFLWPTIVKFTTSEVRVFIEQTSTGKARTYRLEGARPGVDELPGLFDREGFVP